MISDSLLTAVKGSVISAIRESINEGKVSSNDASEGHQPTMSSQFCNRRLDKERKEHPRQFNEVSFPFE